MPLYDYKCLKCHYVTEVLCKFDEKPQSLTCKHCNSNAVFARSPFNFPRKSVGFTRAAAAQTLPREPTETAAERVGFHIGENTKVNMTGCTATGGDVGVSLGKGADVSLKDMKFRDVTTPIKVRKKDEE